MRSKKAGPTAVEAAVKAHASDAYTALLLVVEFCFKAKVQAQSASHQEPQLPGHNGFIHALSALKT